MILISEHYQASGYCMEEARRLWDSHVSGRASLVPVKLDAGRVPTLLSSVQYVRATERTPAQVVDRLVARLDGAP